MHIENCAMDAFDSFYAKKILITGGLVLLEVTWQEPWQIVVLVLRW